MRSSRLLVDLGRALAVQRRFRVLDTPHLPPFRRTTGVASKNSADVFFMYGRFSSPDAKRPRRSIWEQTMGDRLWWQLTSSSLTTERAWSTLVRHFVPLWPKPSKFVPKKNRKQIMAFFSSEGDVMFSPKPSESAPKTKETNGIFLSPERLCHFPETLHWLDHNGW